MLLKQPWNRIQRVTTYENTISLKEAPLSKSCVLIGGFSVWIIRASWISQSNLLEHFFNDFNWIFQVFTLFARLAVDNMKSNRGKVLLFEIEMLIPPGDKVTFGFTNVRHVCVTQTCKLINCIWHQERWRCTFQREVISDLKRSKYTCNVTTIVFLNDLSQLFLEFSWTIANVGNFTNYSIGIILTISVGITYTRQESFFDSIKKVPGVPIHVESLR